MTFSRAKPPDFVAVAKSNTSEKIIGDWQKIVNAGEEVSTTASLSYFLQKNNLLAQLIVDNELDNYPLARYHLFEIDSVTGIIISEVTVNSRKKKRK